MQLGLDVGGAVGLGGEPIASAARARASSGRPRAIATWVRPSSDHSRLRVKPTSRLSRLPSAKWPSAASRSSLSQAIAGDLGRRLGVAPAGRAGVGGQPDRLGPHLLQRGGQVQAQRQQGGLGSSMIGLTWPARRPGRGPRPAAVRPRPGRRPGTGRTPWPGWPGRSGRVAGLGGLDDSPVGRRRRLGVLAEHAVQVGQLGPGPGPTAGRAEPVAGPRSARAPARSPVAPRTVPCSSRSSASSSAAVPATPASPRGRPASGRRRPGPPGHAAAGRPAGRRPRPGRPAHGPRLSGPALTGQADRSTRW